MLHVILFQPEIPPNTGNVIRLCANTGAHLHLVHPLGFDLDERRMRRAGLDYHEYANVSEHESLEDCLATLQSARVLACTTRGSTTYSDISFRDGDALLFGPETRGLPQALLDSMPAEQVIRIPMRPDNRSLNLSNAVAVVVFEAWRQQGFAGGS
ncbi:MAG: tRNA (uridine(34)/cytosine(34)/5-carboxymethylaminomethyluridine(34)-2'-O)-methyltransferase TrmL [Gammaproteobacteria bacterium]|nr:tRNA (uridine(34)/cytosine(34)/5-carboxymethylaminomethyluridine(34)-2'-O)-methyltransferase TrmL [Gammaproteobacteria bacterium]NNF60141.1 tRNA (uridine(34)/cytosine(34)/5-carboxymethylaminomethyluridine(34)-2'-O)-methyltransferase TrmL [Gammaproteobacteria bacterium]NNM21553.1 tRNA (uridine(34)/cytosine(34)/5-carboxymethylaminomethyluridine(34)-2'-O)-methyltransferase TrmL [Gammaproteobacteria bacterium]